MDAAILKYLKANGEQLNGEIAKALHTPPAVVHRHLMQLSTAGEVICCKVTRYTGGKKIEDISCRLSAHVPPRATGPKPGAKRGANNVLSEANPDDEPA